MAGIKSLAVVCLFGVGLALALWCLISWWKYDKERVAALQVILIGTAAVLGVLKYWHEQNESRRMATREMALQHLVVGGVLVAASELRGAGQHVISTWSYANSIRRRENAAADLDEWGKRVLTNECCRAMVYGTNTRLAEAIERAYMIHPAIGCAIANSYARLCDLMRVVTLEPTSFLQTQESTWQLGNLYSAFAAGVAEKAAEILVDDDSLNFNTHRMRDNPRLTRLIGFCEAFKSRDRAWVDSLSPEKNQRDQNVRQENERTGRELNRWLIQVIDGKDGLDSI